MSIYLTITPTAGSDILEVSKEAIALANRTGCNVDFKFNGVTCFAVVGGDPELLVKNWNEEIGSKRLYKYAHSTRPDSPKPRPEEVKQKDWEIVSVRHSTTKRVQKLDKSPFDQNVLKASAINPDGSWQIHSVKRMSDGEVFTVGDDEKVLVKITSFKISHGRILAYNQYDNWYFLEQLQKLPSQPKQPEPESVRPQWYTRKEIYDYLIHKNYSKDIAYELADMWFEDLQRAFKKGWEKATNDGKSGTFDYKYFNAAPQPKQKERNKVMELNYEGVIPRGHVYLVTTTLPIQTEKWPTVKAAIEHELNDDWSEDFRYPESQLQDAFNAGRSIVGPDYHHFSYLHPTFQDYKNGIK